MQVRAYTTAGDGPWSSAVEASTKESSKCPQITHTSVWRHPWVKVGFHYPSSRPEFTGRVDGCQKNAPEFSSRQLGPWTRVVETDLKAQFPLKHMQHTQGLS